MSLDVYTDHSYLDTIVGKKVIHNRDIYNASFQQ